MKYLDEFQDPELAKRLLDDIHATATQPWAMMEVCGGQTHSIIRHGLDQLLPDGHRADPRPGCPVCVTPLEVIDKALEIASRPGRHLLLVRRHAARAGQREGPVPGQERRAATSASSTRRWTRSTIARENPDRQVVFFGIGFETTAPPNAMTVYQAKKLGIENFSLLVSHVRVPPAIEAIMTSPTLPGAGVPRRRPRLQRDGHAEYPPLAERFGVPIVVTGFEPLDILEGIRRTVHQLEEGRARGRERLPAGRPAGGQPGRDRDAARTSSRSPTGAGAGIGMIPQSGWRLSEKYREFDAEYRFEVGDIHTQESTVCRSGEVLQGLIKPHECAAFGKRVHAAQPARRDHGVQRGRLRGVLPLPAAAAAAAARATARGGELRWLSTIELTDAAPDFEGWTCPLPLRDSPTVVMGHGGGGAMSAELVEHVFLPAFADAAARAARRLGGARRRRRPAGVLHRLVRGAAAVLPRRQHRRPRGQRHGQRPGDERGHAGVPVRRRSSSRRAPTSPWSAPSRSGSARRRERAGVRVVTGDTKVVESGHGDGVYVNTAGIGLVPDGVDIRPDRAASGRRGHRQRRHRRARRRDHERARGAASSAPRSAATARR